MPGPNVSTDLRDSIAFVAGVFYLGAREITVGPVVVSDSDFSLSINQTVAGALPVPLPDAAGLSTTPGSRRLRIFDGKGDAGTNNITITGTGALIDGAASVVISSNWGGVDLEWRGTYWHVLNALSAAVAPAAHAASHRAGGSDPLLAAPGAIGGTTPSPDLNADHLDLSGTSSPTHPAVLTTPTTDNGLQIISEASAAVFVTQTLEANGVNGTATRRRLYAVTLLDDGSLDIGSLGLGGHGTVSAVGATASVSGSFSYAANGAATANGLTFANFDVADTDTKLCAFASGGNLRIRNRLGSTQTVIVDLTQLVAAA